MTRRLERAEMLRILRLALLSGAAKGPGFLIPVVVAAFFGAGGYTDAYFLAYSGFLLAGGTIGPALEMSVVPFAARGLSRGRESAASLVERFTHDARRWSLAAMAVGAIGLALGLAVAPPHGVDRADVMRFYLCLAPAIVCWCLAGVYTGSLAAAWQLEANAIGYAFRGLGALAGAAVGIFAHTLWTVAVGISAGEAVRVLWLRARWRRALAAAPAEGEAGVWTEERTQREFRSASGHLVTSQAILTAAPLIERFVAGAIALAAISRIEYASRLISVAAVFFDGAVGPWLLSHWSNLRARDSLRFDWHGVMRPIALGSAMALGVAALLALGAGPIVQVALVRGKFTADDAAIVTTLLRWYAAGFFFTMTALCVERLLLAQSRSGVFLGLGGVRLTVRLGAIALLVGPMGIVGLPMAGMIADALHVVLLLVASRGWIGGAATRAA